MMASHISHCEDCSNELKNLQIETGDEKQEDILNDDAGEEEDPQTDVIPSFRRLRRKMIVRRCLIAFVTALACIS